MHSILNTNLVSLLRDSEEEIVAYIPEEKKNYSDAFEYLLMLQMISRSFFHFYATKQGTVHIHFKDSTAARLKRMKKTPRDMCLRWVTNPNSTFCTVIISFSFQNGTRLSVHIQWSSVALPYLLFYSHHVLIIGRPIWKFTGLIVH